MTDYHSHRFICTGKYLVLIFALAILQACSPDQLDKDEKVSQSLGLEFLLGSEPLASPQPTYLFMAPEHHLAPSNHFEGVLTLTPESGLNHIEILTDTFSIAANETLRLKELPPFSFRFVMDGIDIIPLEREPQSTTHPNWEIIAEPGIAWDETGDSGWSHAALPFTLKEKNENCLHNGLMKFLYKDSGSITRVAWQITSETCLYVKVNLWGVVDASYEPGSISLADKVKAAYRDEVANRLPVKPISALREDYPDLEPAAFNPPGIDDFTAYGFVIDGVNYRSECPTRFGPYPFCEVLDLPSYSLAKSMFGGLAYQLLNNRWPEFATIPVSELIPECKTPDKRWDDVMPIHLLNMTTGNYDSQVINADEDAEKMVAFFLAKTHDDKVRFSCEAWPRQSKPGTQWAYHTTDTYLLGVAMNRFLKQKLGPQFDIYGDLLYPEVFKPLGLSPVLQWTHRTYDETAQPFTGYGLVVHTDDIARLAQALNADQSTHQYLAATDFDKSVLPSRHEADTYYAAARMAYSLGFWGVDASRWLPCQSTSWIPFMSGYGGITVAMFPNGSIYYYFTDSNKHGFRTAAEEANKALNYCEE